MKYFRAFKVKSFQRILNRDRAAERSLKLEYLDSLNDQYNRKISTLKNVHVVDANQPLDKVKSDVINILNQI